MRSAAKLLALVLCLSGALARDALAGTIRASLPTRGIGERVLPHVTGTQTRVSGTLTYPDYTRGETVDPVKKQVASKDRVEEQTVSCSVPAKVAAHVHDWKIDLTSAFVKIENKSAATLQVRWAHEETRYDRTRRRHVKYWKWTRWQRISPQSEGSYSAPNKLLSESSGLRASPQRMKIRYEIKDAKDGSWVWGPAPYEVTWVLHCSYELLGPHRR